MLPRSSLGNRGVESGQWRGMAALHMRESNRPLPTVSWAMTVPTATLPACSLLILQSAPLRRFCHHQLRQVFDYTPASSDGHGRLQRGPGCCVRLRVMADLHDRVETICQFRSSSVRRRERTGNAENRWDMYLQIN
jgi:hypothetical protein